MSQLIDKLNQVSKVVPQTMGFRTAQPALSKPQMLLIASWAKAEDIDSMAEHVAGADAVLLHITKTTSGTKAFQKIAGSLPGTPWGGWLGDTEEKKAKAMVGAGCDFVVFPAASPVLAPSHDGKVGKILQVESTLSESLLKAVNELPVDAVLASDEREGDYPLTWHHLMLFQRLANLLTKPLLVVTPSNVTGDELKAIWKAGADGVVVEVSAGQPNGRLAELRQIISDRNFLPPRKRRKAEALVPRIGMETGTTTDIEEDDDEE